MSTPSPHPMLRIAPHTRTLSVLRHAKSSWDAPALADCDRPLAPRGRKAAPRMGQHMRDIGLAPDLVICSTAVRTRETADLALAEWRPRPAPTMLYERSVYEAPALRLLARLREAPDSARHVLLIGHNPGLQDLVHLLVGDALPPEHAWLDIKLPTGALVVLEIAIDAWPSLQDETARIVHAARPRDLPG